MCAIINCGLVDLELCEVAGGVAGACTGVTPTPGFWAALRGSPTFVGTRLAAGLGLLGGSRTP